MDKHQFNANSYGFSVVELLIVMVIFVIIGLTGYFVFAHNKNNSQTNNSTATSSTNTTASSTLIPPTVPNNKVYLGAFVNPKHISSYNKKNGSQAPGSNVIQQLPAFNQLVGKHLAILHFYMPFNSPVPTSTLNAIEANGSIPLISWGCTNLGSITSGKYDSYITSYADSLKSFGKPVFLRWYWEMNIMNKTGGQPAGANCGGYNNGSAYIAAWQHIYTLFHTAGATNVAFVWCPGFSGGSFASYYPGDAYVNWIGLDRYERTQNGQPLLDFSGMFASYYQEWASHNKPLMIAETAAMGNLDQSQYINDIQTQAVNYPNIKAFVWFDATGPAGDWELAGNGITAFQQLANDPYFSE